MLQGLQLAGTMAEGDGQMEWAGWGTGTSYGTKQGPQAGWDWWPVLSRWPEDGPH